MAAKKKAEAIQNELKEVNQELEALDEELLTEEEIEEISEEEEKPKKARKTKKAVVKADEEDEEIEKPKFLSKEWRAEIAEEHPTGCKVAKCALKGIAAVGIAVGGYLMGKGDALASIEFLNDDEEETTTK